MEGGLRDDQADCRIGDESTYGGDGEMWRGEPSYDDRYSDEQSKGCALHGASIATVAAVRVTATGGRLPHPFLLSCPLTICLRSASSSVPSLTPLPSSPRLLCREAYVALVPRRQPAREA